MKENSEINNTRKKINFEEKVINKKGPRESLIKLFDKDDITNLIYVNKNIQTQVVCSLSYRASGMYVDYLNHLRKIVDGIATNGNKNDNDNGKIFIDFVNEVLQEDLGKLNKSLVKKGKNEKEKFFYDNEKMKMNPLLEKCLKVYMVQMILLDLLSITEKDFKKCDGLENSSMESTMAEIINKRQQERIDKIFDIVVNKQNCEIITFWDEIKKINEKKYNELSAKRENESRDIIYTFLFQKIFDIMESDDQKNIMLGIYKKMNEYENETVETIETEIYNSKSQLQNSQNELYNIAIEIKNLEDRLTDLNANYGNAEQIIELPKNKLNLDKQFIISAVEKGLKVIKDDLSTQIANKKKIQEDTENEIKNKENNISNLRNRLEEKKLLEQNSGLILNMFDIAKNQFKKFQSDMFNFLLNHPDRISSFPFVIFNLDFEPTSNFDLFQSKHGPKTSKYFRDFIVLKFTMRNFIHYLLEKSEDQYFYPALIQIIELISHLQTYQKKYYGREIFNSIENIDTNIENKRAIIFLVEDTTKEKFNDISLCDVYFTGACVLEIYYAIVYWIFCLSSVSVIIAATICLIVIIAHLYRYISRKIFDIIARREWRVISSNAREKLEECRRRTQTYKRRLQNQEKIFDKYLKDNQANPIQEQIKENEEEIKT